MPCCLYKEISIHLAAYPQHGYTKFNLLPTNWRFPSGNSSNSQHWILQIYHRWSRRERINFLLWHPENLQTSTHSRISQRNQLIPWSNSRIRRTFERREIRRKVLFTTGRTNLPRDWSQIQMRINPKVLSSKNRTNYTSTKFNWNRSQIERISTSGSTLEPTHPIISLARSRLLLLRRPSWTHKL